MVKTWLLRAVVFFALVCASTLLSSDETFAKYENYSWKSYSTIGVYGGSFKEISETEGGATVATFTQSKPNSRTYIARNIDSNCQGPLTLTISPNPTKASLSVENCPNLKDYDTSIVINTLGSATRLVEKEVRAIALLHKEKMCPEGVNQDSCATDAAEVYTAEQKRCSTDHDYKKDIVISDAYLECLANALGVERPNTISIKEKEEDTAESCQIPSIGWLACQLTEFIATLTDQTFQLIKPFFEIDPLTKEIGARPNDTSTTYSAWQTLRDIANISLVIGFFFIIYSYLTGLGMNTYSIKRSLPRLVVCAVLINISFFVCGAMIDLSNIAGRSLQELTTDFSDVNLSQSEMFQDWSSVTKRVNSITATDEEFTKESVGDMSEKERERLGLPVAEPEQPKGLTDDTESTQEDEPSSKEPAATAMVVNGTVIFGSLVLYANLAVLIPLMVIALFAMFVTLMILLFRHALIIVLVVVSPLAIAAYILPGTKQWFDKWNSTFTQLLLLYPIIAIIFAGSQIASEVILESAQNNGQTLLAIFSMAIGVIPLIVTPLLLKFGGGIMSQFGGTIKGIISKPRGAALGAANQFRKDRKVLQRARRANNLYVLGRLDGNRNVVTRGIGKIVNVGAAIRIGRARREAKIEKDFQSYTAANFRNLAKGVRDKSLLTDAMAIQAAAIKEARLEKVEAAVASFEGLSSSQVFDMALQSTAQSGLSDIERQAAIRMAMQNATMAEARELMETLDTMDEGQRDELVDGLNTPREDGAKLSSQAPDLGAGAQRRMRDGTPGAGNMSNTIASGANSGAFSGSRLSDADPDTLARLYDLISMSGSPINDEAAAQIRRDAREELDGSRSGYIRDRAGLERLAGRR